MGASALRTDYTNYGNVVMTWSRAMQGRTIHSAASTRMISVALVALAERPN
ncbi:MAG: hypothetical protein JWN44_7259 [Myxococcales bacterium]|nr:hypothetical protein [Myxococcales bacterium]